MLNNIFGHVKWVLDTEKVELGTGIKLFTTLNFTNISLTLLAVIILIGLGFLGYKLMQKPSIQKAHQSLQKYEPFVSTALSIALGVVLIVSAYDYTLLAPELRLSGTRNLLLYFEYLLGVLLILGLFTKLAALGTLLLYVVGIFLFNVMLIDYIEVIGVCIYLILKGRKALGLDQLIPRVGKIPDLTYYSNLAMPIMRILTGITLFWLGLDKWLRPEWGLAIIKNYHLYTFGFNWAIFVFGAGLVEMAVGLAVIGGILNRVVAFVVLGLFITTGIIFGLRELVGHLVLIAFLFALFIEGSGGYQIENWVASTFGKGKRR